MADALATPCRVRRNRHRWRKTASRRQHYNYFRDYDPSTGRYVQSDPAGLADGTATYAYVGSSPLRMVDPLGLWGMSPQIGPSYSNTPARKPPQPPNPYPHRRSVPGYPGYFMVVHPDPMSLEGKSFLNSDGVAECVEIVKQGVEGDEYLNGVPAGLIRRGWTAQPSVDTQRPLSA